MKNSVFRSPFYATRDAENHSVRYFDSVRDVKELQSQVFEKLESVYDDISMGVMVKKIRGICCFR